MHGRVILTNSADFEIDRIRFFSEGRKRKIYVYGEQLKGVDAFKRALPDFHFLRLAETRQPERAFLFHDNSDDDLFVIKYPWLSDIMDRDIEAHQTTLKGFKVVVIDHPYMRRGQLYWSYFPWSFVDKSLLGYPHCYAFKSDLNRNSMTPAEVAKKLSPGTETSLKAIFEESIIVKRVSSEEGVKTKYQELKSKLFEEVSSPSRIISHLKKFSNSTHPILKSGFDLRKFNNLYDQYLAGTRELYLSDLNVDLYLEKQFWEYIGGVNEFVRTLWESQH